MPSKFTNNAFGTLASSITNTATTITLTSGNGSRFPSLSAGEFFYATLIDSSNNLEIVQVTARATDALTVVRGQDGSTARAYAAGDRIELRPVAAALTNMVQLDGAQTITGAKTFSGSTTLSGGGTISGTYAGTSTFSGNVTFSNTITGSISGSAASATNATNVAVTDDTTTAATYYPSFVTATTGNTGVRLSSTKLTYNPSTGTLSSTAFSGSGASLTSLNASNLASGTVGTARLGTGTANSTTYLRGDQTWATISGGVTSLNGQTGAIDNTTVGSIGNYVVCYYAVNGPNGGGTATYTRNNYGVGTTAAGSDLRYNVLSDAWGGSTNNSYKMETEVVRNGQTPSTTAAPVWNAGGTALTGSWRSMSAFSNVTYANSSKSIGPYVSGQWRPALWVRYA